MGDIQNSDTVKKRDPGRTIEVLFKISEAVSRSGNLHELYATIHKNLDDILNVDNFYIALLDESEDVLSFVYHVDEKDKDPEEIKNFSRTKTSTGMVIQSRKPMIFFEQDIIRLADRHRDRTVGSISKVWLGAPLVINDRVKGAVVIQSYASAAAYEKEDLNLLNSISQHIALAIERKQSEDMLTEQRSVLEKILETSPVGIALVQERIFKWVNTEMVRMFGYSSKTDFENKSTRMIYPGIKEYDTTGKTIYAGLSQDGVADYEIDLIKNDGRRFPAHIRLHCGDASNPMAWTIATISDISQRKVAEKERVERERLQGVLEMAGAVCHEINQPLQAILGYSEILMMASEIDHIKENAVISIKSQANRLGKITQKLSGITHYRTVEYPGNTKIVDIWGAGTDAVHRPELKK